jgi:prephenate dehydratase
VLALPPNHYGYYGPVGTFTHQALLTLPALPDEPTAYATVAQALQAVRDGDVAAALVPIENSVEGGVSATLDNLANGEPLRIVREVVLPVQFRLFARSGMQLQDVRRVLTHPHAAAQCRDWLADNLPLAIITEGGSKLTVRCSDLCPDRRRTARPGTASERHC